MERPEINTADLSAKDETAAFNTLLSLSGVGVVQVDFEGRIVRVNRRYGEILGYTQDELISKAIADITHPDDRRRDEDSLHEMLAGRLQEYCVEKRYVRKDGAVIAARLTAALVRDTNGKPVCSMGVVQDITDYRRIESALQHHKDLAHSTQVLTMSQLAVQIAHEINQPLAAIAGYTQGCLMRLAKVKGVPPDILEALEQANAQAHRAGEIVRRMKKLARKDKPSRVPTEVNPLILRAAKIAMESRPANDVRVKADLADGLPLISLDITQVEQVVINLVTNAIDAVLTPGVADPKVTIRSRRRGDGHVVVSVLDTGPGLVGIRAEDLFEPFTTTKPSGLGMGLSICRSIIEAHGGRLTATPHGSRGMCFEFAIPAPTPDAPTPT